METEEKFFQLLELVGKKTPKEISEELTYISALVWEKYLKVKTVFLSHDDLLKAAEDFSED